MSSRTVIIATGPHGFGGAVQALYRALRGLVTHVDHIIYVALDKPVPLRVPGHQQIEFIRATLFESGPIGYHTAPVVDKHVLLPAVLAETMVRAAHQWPQHRLILWGTYLFPFAQSSLLAAQTLNKQGFRCDVWLSPTGSDVLDIGMRLPGIAQTLLTSPLVQHIITPSQRFADAIHQLYGVERVMQHIYPMIDTERFSPLSADERRIRRAELGFSERDVILSCHGSMRPVKRPEDTLLMAEQVAQRSTRPVILLMIGPRKPPLEDFAEQHCAHVDVRWMGVLSDVERYLQIADFEINTSWYDSFNLSLAEAMACGVPCISTDVVGIAPEIIAAEAGYLFPYVAAEDGGATHYPAAVSYILSLLDDDTRRHTMGSNGAQHAPKAFGEQPVIAAYLDLLNQPSQQPEQDAAKFEEGSL